MADHRPRRGGRIVLDAVQGIARALLCEPARGVHLDLAGALGAGLRFDRARLCCARLVRPDRASSISAGGSAGRSSRSPPSPPTPSPTTSAPRFSPARSSATAPIRPRASAWRRSALLVAFCSFTFGLGAVHARRPAARSFAPTSSNASTARRTGSGRRPALVLLAAPCLYVLGSLLHFPPFKLGGFELDLSAPAGRGAAIAGRAARADRRGRDHLLRPARRAIPASSSCSACSRLVLAWRWSATRPAASAFSRSPFSKAMPDAPQANVVAALLVFRLLYLIIPFVFALAVVLAFERHRWRSLVTLGARRAHAVDDPD